MSSRVKHILRCIFTSLAFAFCLSATGQQLLYVPSQQPCSINIMDLSTNTLAGSIGLSACPGGLALTRDGAYLYVAEPTANSVVMISTTLRAITATIPLGATPMQLATNPSGTRLYVLHQNQNQVSVVDTTARTLVAVIPVGKRPSGIAITPDESTILVTNLYSSTVSVISATTNSVIATWLTSFGPSGITISPDGATVYVANQYSNVLSVYNMSGTILGSVTGLVYPNAIAVKPDGSELYVTNGNSASVSVIATGTLKSLATISIGHLPTAIAVSPDGVNVYATNLLDNSISVINTATETLASTIQNAAQSPLSVALGTSPPVLPPLPPSIIQPTLPQKRVDVTYPHVTGTTIAVHAGDDLEKALDSANCGDEIVIDAGAVFTGNYTVPSRPCTVSNRILVRSSQLASLPAAGRVQQSQANLMPTLQSGNANSVLIISKSSGWYFAGINFTVASGVKGLWNLINVGNNPKQLSDLPADIVFDRVLVHGNEQYCTRGFIADATRFALINSQVWNFLHVSQDTQALMICSTNGPILIQNNFLEATGENVMLGGGTPSISDAVPADVTVTGNYFHKQLAWENSPAGCGPGTSVGQCYDVKNHFEIKNGQRVLVDSNVFDTTFSQAQKEFWIVNCGYAGPFTCQDITYTNNLLMHGPMMWVGGGNGNGVTGTRILLRNNLGTDISTAYGVGAGFNQLGGTTNLTIDHNTVIGNPFKGCGTSTCTQSAFFFGDSVPGSNHGLTITNNIFTGSLGANALNPLGVYNALMAVAGNNVSYDAWVADITPVGGTRGFPSDAFFWPLAAPGCTMSYAPATCYAPDWSLVGFEDFAGGNYELSPTSILHNAGNDGYDVGANVAAVLSATSGAR